MLRKGVILFLTAFAAVLGTVPAAAATAPPDDPFTVKVLIAAVVANADGSAPKHASSGYLDVSTDSPGLLRIEFLPCDSRCTPIVRWRTILTPEAATGMSIPAKTTRFRLTRYNHDGAVTAVSPWYRF